MASRRAWSAVASRGAAALGLAVVGLSLAPVGAHAADAPPPAAKPAAEPATEETFCAALEKARRLLVVGSPKAAQRVFDDALVAHAEKDYVRAKRAEVEDLARRVAFCAACPPPAPATLVKGSLKRWNPTTGDIDIRYAAGTPHDFESTKDDGLVFPARFSGPYTVVVRGESYPYDETGPSLCVGLEEDPKSGKRKTWVIVPGFPERVRGDQRVWLPARIVYTDGSERQTLAEKDPSPVVPGSSWRLEVAVTKERLSASVNGKAIGSAAKPATVFGYMLLFSRDWSEIVITGKVEPSWIQSKVDAIVETARTKFEGGYTAKDHLPAWLYAGPAAAADAPAASDESLLALKEVPAALRNDVMRVTIELASGEGEYALEAIASLRRKGLPEALASLLEARAYLALDRTTDALSAIEKALAASPGRVDLLALKASVLDRLGRDDDALATWKDAAARPDAGKDILLAACLSLLVAGQPEAARAVSEDAARRGVRSDELDRVARVLVQASNGPSWGRTFQAKSANYVVTSDMDAEVCYQATQVLEDALATFRAQVHELRPEAKRKQYRVFLFSGQAGFSRYLSDVTILSGKQPENLAGVYSGLLKQLLIWNLPNRAEMMRTVRHEGFHQYLDRLLPDPPVWFNEGMAVYYEGMEKGGGASKAGGVRPDDLRLLEQKPFGPVAPFLKITPPRFYAAGVHSYAKAWLLVHMMRHGPLKYRDAYKALLLKLETQPGVEAVQEVFDEKLLATIDADLEAYRKTLKP